MITQAQETGFKEHAERLEKELTEAGRQIRELNAELVYAKRQLEAFKRKLFGSPRSEKISDEQLRLALEELEREDTEQKEALREKIAGEPRERGKRGRTMQRLPEDIEVVTVELIPQEVQAEPDSYERIGEVVTEELDIEPMRIIKRRIVRPKFKRKAELDAVPLTARLPARVIPGGLPSARLVAWLIVAKYVEHLPLYRIERILRRHRVEVSRRRLCDWIGYVAENWLTIIYRAIRQGLLGGDYLQIDETPIRYLDPDNKGKSHKGYLWAYGRPGGDLCFDWTQGRGGEHAKAILKGFKGRLQSDGYQAYDSCGAGQPEVIQLGCWAHARRKFYEAWQHGEEGAVNYLLDIRELYAIEAKLPDNDMKERLRIRQEQSRPVLARIKTAQQTDQEKHLHKSAMGDALGYLGNQWDKLTAYIDHPDTRIDNNLTEQAIRPTKLGVKNWLFIGSPQAGPRCAIIYTVIESCRRHGVEPLAYLTDVLTRLPAMATTDLPSARILPSNWSTAS